MDRDRVDRYRLHHHLDHEPVSDPERGCGTLLVIAAIIVIVLAALIIIRNGGFPEYLW